MYTWDIRFKNTESMKQLCLNLTGKKKKSYLLNNKITRKQLVEEQ